jgi:hypothetical protein
MTNYIHLDSQSTVPRHYPKGANAAPQTAAVTPRDCSDLARIPFSSLLYYILVVDDALPA